MNNLIFKKILNFSKLENTDYINIIKNNTDYINTCRGKINSAIVFNALNNFTIGFIYISKKIPYRHQNRDNFLKLMEGYHYDLSSDEDDYSEINYSKISIDGFILGTLEEYDEFDILYIDVICCSEKNKGLSSNLLKTIFKYCEDEIIKYCTLSTPFPELVEYYKKHGFILKNIDENNDFFMEKEIDTINLF